MPSCKKIEPLLSSYHDGELGKAQRRQVAEHLKACPHCRKQLEAIEAISRAFGAVDSLEVTEEFQDRLHLALVDAAREHRMQSSKQNTSWYYRIPRWLRDWRTYSAAVACLVIAVVFGTGAFRDYSKPTPAAPVATAALPTQSPQAAGAVQTGLPSPQPESDGAAVADMERKQEQASPSPDLSEATGGPVSEKAQPAARPAPDVTTTPASAEQDNSPQTNPDTTPQMVPDIAQPSKSADGETGSNPTPAPQSGGSSVANTISAYGISRTTLYFKAADETALQIAAQIAREYGEVTVSGTEVTVRVSSENYAPLLSALYSAQAIVQIESNCEPDTETEPVSGEAADLVCLVISL